MRWSLICAAAVFAVIPSSTKAQSAGRVECPRAGGYVYLYSSMLTLDVRTTLQCGQQVQITGRYDEYFGVRTAKGEIGYVPLDSVLLIKDVAGANPEPAIDPKTARERTPYDAATSATESSEKASAGPDFILRNGLAVHLKVSKAVSSATAHVGDKVALEAVEDVMVDGLLVIAKGAAAKGTVTDAETKKKLGRGGKVGVVVNSVELIDKETAAIRGYQEASGANSATGTVIAIKSGKDVELSQGTEVLAWVDGDVHLKRAGFAPAASKSGAAPNVEKSSLASPN